MALKFVVQCFTDDLEFSTLQNAIKSPLLRLPGEVRNRIYEYALGGEEVCCSYYKRPYLRPGQPNRTGKEKYPLSLLMLPQVCRQIHAESALLPYHLNDFWFDMTYASEDMSGSLKGGYGVVARFTDAQLNSIRSLCIYLSQLEYGIEEELLANSSFLHELDAVPTEPTLKWLRLM